VLYFVNIIFLTIIYELLSFFNFFKILRILVNFSKKIIFTILSKKISDQWKEKVLLNYSFHLFKSSLKILIILTMIFLTIYLINYFEKKFISYLLSLNGIILSTIYILFYHKIRNFIK
jgi:hypothetical protein